MILHLIVGYYAGQDRSREMPSILDVWDEWTRESNEEGFHEAVAKAGAAHKDIRLLDVSIPDDAVTSLWAVPEVQGTSQPGAPLLNTPLKRDR